MALGFADAGVLAFDVGGTDMKSGVVTADGTVLALQRHKTPLDPQRPGEAILERIEQLYGEYSHQFPAGTFEAVGITVPGLVDEVHGVGIYSANLGWRDFPFRDLAEQRLGIPVAFGHDVASAGSAEMELGAAREFQDAMVMVVGTGIAAAIFTSGRPVTAGGFAGEIGHAMVPDPDGQGSVILESVGSAGAIAKRYRRITGTEVDGAREVLERAMTGEPEALKVWNQAVEALAFSICQCVSILGTEAVVIGGGLSAAGEALLEPLRSAVDDALDFQRRPVIRAAALGQDAGMLGSALKARARLLEVKLS
ncbi:MULTISPECIES: ROK family protein [Arthrobacter]|uniref:ROK family protein n=2 Tax=Arthrobacter TaxID=1663 RepID=A0ABU9KN76_9MICC|nr:ROK family protein [Arthrobacter sp. YJM1]MDP5228296.1 ROK family protein [Arthrobacter sp. YJM1]